MPHAKQTEANRDGNLTEELAGRRWTIDRYLLGDPDLDQTAFEQAMLEDAELAKAVADRVADLEILALAATEQPHHKSVAVVQPRQYSRGILNSRALTICGMAATLMLALLITFAQNSKLSQSETIATSVDSESRSELAYLAETWIALESDESDLEAVAGIGSADGLSFLTELTETTESSSEEEDDWMLEAAQLYFDELES